jgi:malate dehydrogenase (oxaloacetate-decarboxylating)
MYMGARHKRIGQKEYDEFVDMFINAVQRRWPEVMLQFEDFAQPNAMPLLERYRKKICCFNDDIQGTAAVAVGTILAACKSKNSKISQQKVAFVGAGSAGCGIAEMIVKQMCSEGISDSQARSQVFMIDRFGLLTNGMQDLRDFQQRLVQSTKSLETWKFSGDYASLLDVVNCAKPDILIGVSGQAGLFSELVIRGMKKHCELPIIFPLSNPSKQVEATPEQVIEWTDGQVIIATGSPFKPVEYKGRSYPIAQCNNSYIFPGIGLGVIVAEASLISDAMLMVTSATLAEASPLATNGEGALLPAISDIAGLSKKIAFEVAKMAMQEGLALEVSDEVIHERIEKNFWLPEYRSYKRVSI